MRLPFLSGLGFGGRSRTEVVSKSHDGHGALEPGPSLRLSSVAPEKERECWAELVFGDRGLGRTLPAYGERA